MDTFWGLTGTGWTAVYTLLTAGLLLLAVLTVVTAAISAGYAKKQWQIARASSEDARRAAVEASRPYVIVSVLPSGASPRLFDLSIRNIGARPALAVRVEIDPPPTRARETDGDVFAAMKMLNEPIAMIAPGQELRAFWDNHLDRSGRDDLPRTHNVTLAYRDSSGRSYGPERSVLDLGAMDGSKYVGVRTVHDVAKTLEAIRDIVAGASVLSADGTLTVEAAVEDRKTRDRRLRDEAVISRMDQLRSQREFYELVTFQDDPDESVQLQRGLEAKMRILAAEYPDLFTPEGEDLPRSTE